MFHMRANAISLAHNCGKGKLPRQGEAEMHVDQTGKKLLCTSGEDRGESFFTCIHARTPLGIWRQKRDKDKEGEVNQMHS